MRYFKQRYFRQRYWASRVFAGLPAGLSGLLIRFGFGPKLQASMSAGPRLTCQISAYPIITCTIGARVVTRRLEK